MDSKTWLWKKKYSEKTVVANSDTDLCSFDAKEQVSFDEKELILQESLDLLNDKLASILRECDVKDELVADYAEKAENASAGKEKAESEVSRLKEELNESLRERAAENERIIQLNAALKGSMQQLNSVREEQEKRICDAVITISKEHQEPSARLTSLTAENSHLKMALIEKEMLVRELSKCKAQTEAELDDLMVKLDSVEKENVFMRYEFRMLEKDFDVCNEEINFSRYSLNASNKQNMESSKKMKKLEEECQRLRGLLRKCLPGPDSLSNITREFELQSSSLVQSRTRHLEPKTRSAVVRNSVMGSLPGNPTMLMERLQSVEEENKVLKEILLNKDGDNNYSISSVFRPSEVDTLLSGPYIFPEHVPYPKSISEAGKDGRILSSQSSASSSLSEVEQCKHEDSKTTFVQKILGISDMSLMDDFLEMEKLAVVAASSQSISDTPSSPNMGDIMNAVLATEITTNGTSTDKELVPVGQIHLNDKRWDHRMLDITTNFEWIQHVTDIIMNQNRVSGGSLKQLVEDVLVSLQEKDSLGDCDACLALNSMGQHQISGVHTERPPTESQRGSSTDEILSDENLLESPRNKIPNSDLCTSIHKIMELIRRLDPHYLAENVESLEGLAREEKASIFNQTSTEANEVIHSYKCRRNEISATTNCFLDICGNMLEGKVNIKKFTEELASELGLFMNSCVSAQVTLSLKDELLAEKQQDENDKEAGLACELEHSKESTRILKAELETLGEVKRMIEIQIQNQKLTNEDLNTQLTVVKAELNEALQKILSLEVELEEKSDCCEELEQKCLELQLQLEMLECAGNKKTSKVDADQESKLNQITSSSFRKERKINEACFKSEECEESILELGKQLVAVASSEETDSYPKLNNRFSLLEQMQLEDTTEEEENKKKLPTKQHTPPVLHLDDSNSLHAPETTLETPKVAPLAITRSKKTGGTITFLKKLLYRRKRRSNRKLSFSLTA